MSLHLSNSNIISTFVALKFEATMEISMILSLGEKIKDPRKPEMVTYSVQLILFITVVAVMNRIS